MQQKKLRVKNLNQFRISMSSPPPRPHVILRITNRVVKMQRGRPLMTSRIC